MSYRYKTEKERITVNVIKEGECWIWQKALDRQGRGVLALAKNNLINAATFSYSVFIKPVSADLTARSICTHEACVNPEHLELVVKPKKYINQKDRILRNIKENEVGCWIWQRSTDFKGYGIVGRPGSENKTQRAHRLSYELFIGKIPENLLVCHKCDVPSCVNPDHLFLGTPSDNTKDMQNKGRAPLGERQGSTKLTESEVLEIREKYKIGPYSQSDLARVYGVTRGTINKIIHRIDWKHV